MASPLLLLLALSWLVHAARDLGADPASDVLISFGYIAVAAVLAGKIADRIGLPKLVGALVVGLVAGPSGLGLVTEQAASALGVPGDTAIAIVVLGVGCQVNVARVRSSSPLVRAIVLCAVDSVGAMAGVLVARFSRLSGRGSAAFAVLVCVVVAVLGARVRPAPVIVMAAAGVWLAGYASASAHALAEQIARVRLPLMLVWGALAGARLG